jgi:hypothetical protein
MNAPASQLASSLLLASVNLIQTMIPNLFRVVSVMLPGSKYAIDSITITLSLRCWFYSYYFLKFESHLRN